MKLKHTIIACATVATVVVAGVVLTPRHVAPPEFYPNASISPGLVATQDFATLTAVSTCGTYSQCHRNTTNAQKVQVRNEYPNCPQAQEIDHIIPLALGGADDVKNLWCQPEVNVWNGQDWGFHAKDKLVAYMVIQMKAGRIAPKDAQDCILNDWVACFNKNIKTSYGAFSVQDPDDAPNLPSQTFTPIK